jgi:hypothetical protein
MKINITIYSNEKGVDFFSFVKIIAFNKKSISCLKMRKKINLSIYKVTDRIFRFL